VERTAEPPSILALKSFLHELLLALPGKELGENVIEFQRFLKNVGLGDAVSLGEKGNISIEPSALPSLNLPEAARKILLYLGDQMDPVLSELYVKLFLETYEEFRSSSEPAANIWLGQLLRDCGGLLSGYGIIDRLPKNVKMPQLFQLMKPGSIHLKKEEKPAESYALVKEAVNYGFKAFCVTKLEPSKIRYRYGLKNSEIIWLTFKKVKERTITPDDLAGLSSFVSGVGLGSVVLFDCFQEIKVVNGFKGALEFFRELRTICAKNKSILVISINPMKLTEEQLSALDQALGGREK
jgi:hypothetical protein